MTGIMLLLADPGADAAGILTDAVRLLPGIAWRRIDRESREIQLGLSGLGCDAAANQMLSAMPT